MNDVTYQYYIDTYKGSLIPDTSFNDIIRDANLFFDYNVINKPTLEDDVIKNCKCRLADEIYQNPTQANLTSESVGGWSRSYQVGSFNDRLITIMKQYLVGRKEMSMWL